MTLAYSQQDTATVGAQSSVAQDDPSQFLTRVEVINELQNHKSIDALNVTTVRSVIALEKKWPLISTFLSFTTPLQVQNIRKQVPGKFFNSTVGLQALGIQEFGNARLIGIQL